MEYKDPMVELLSNLEQIVFKNKADTVVRAHPVTAFIGCEQLRKSTGLKIDDFARAMGVSVSMVNEWESNRVKPSPTELKLMRLIQADPRLSKQLMD